MKNRKCVACLCLFISSFLIAQKAPVVKYWVKFSDKTGTAYSISQPGAFVSPKSISRRKKYNITFNSSDLPVVASYVHQVDTVKNVNVLYASKWLNGVVIAIDSAAVAPDALTKINAYPFVSSSVKVKKYRLSNIEKLDVQQQGKADRTTTDFNYSYGGSLAQNRQIHVDCLHEKGFRGQGLTIAVCDVGFYGADVNPVFDSLNKSGRVKGTYDFVNSLKDVYFGGDHGTKVLSCMAGNKPGVVLGSAPMADYWLFKTEDGSSETVSEEYNWIRAAEYADSVGVDIITTSLGYTEFDDPQQNHTYQTLDGKTAAMSIAANMAARKGIFVANAAGNEGDSPWHYISVPGDADSICTVGAVDTNGVYALFSSVGPTADKRIKPDIVACGKSAFICSGSGCSRGDGTSFATPILAGAVACFWQANPLLNNIQVLESLKKNGSNAANPNNQIGWGIPQLCSFPPKLPDLDFDFEAWSDPANERIIIHLNRSSYDFVSIEILDLLGHSLVTGDANNKATEIKIDGSMLSSSVYLVKVKTSKGTKVKKMLKQ